MVILPDLVLKNAKKTQKSRRDHQLTLQKKLAELATPSEFRQPDKNEGWTKIVRKERKPSSVDTVKIPEAIAASPSEIIQEKPAKKAFSHQEYVKVAEKAPSSVSIESQEPEAPFSSPRKTEIGKKSDTTDNLPQ